MVYQWEPYKDVCYQLYINERRPLEDIMVHMKNVYQFTPSKRAYQVQFSRWQFPTKQRLKHKDDRLVKRVHELWKRNVPQSEMLRILTDEDGFDINSRELMRVRARNRWLLRVRNGDRARSGDGDGDGDAENLENDASLDEEGDVNISLPSEEPRDISQPTSYIPENSMQEDTTSAATAPKPRKISKRQSRRNRQHLTESEHIVRFPSEMTLNDAKEALSFDAATYADTRECFARICQEESIVKKTQAGPGRWDYVKNRLIHERPHLQQVLWLSKDDLERKQLALDVICTDVTKRLRNQDTRMTLVDAKNELGLNPEESHEIRAALHEVLCDAKFTCKSDGTPEQWEELKKRWLEKSERMREIPLHGDDEQSRRKIKAVEIVARDVIKRRRDEKRVKAKSGETSKQKETPKRKSHDDTPQRNVQDSKIAEVQPNMHQQAQPAVEDPSAFTTEEGGASGSSTPIDPMMDQPMDNSGYEPVHEPVDSRMDYTTTGQPPAPQRPVQVQLPALGMPTSQGVLPQPHRMLGSSATNTVPMDAQYGSSMYLGNQPQANYMQQHYVQHQFSASTPGAMFSPVPSVPAVPASFAVFMRLHPSSTYPANTNLWISTMSSHSIQELRHVAVTKFPGAMCVRIEGIIKDPKGNELPLQIQGDDELAAYFDHMQSGTPTFAVQLVQHGSI
ncbi:hypothetical protein IL306_008602 [Fusarium sp. DS 682]|nr:hypothetical protein IL306_008602 [Fusarium sp. DS 682]